MHLDLITLPKVMVLTNIITTKTIKLTLMLLPISTSVLMISTLQPTLVIAILIMLRSHVAMEVIWS